MPTRKSISSQILDITLKNQQTMGNVNTKLTSVLEKVENHNKVLYGKPEEMGKGGLIHKQGEQDGKINGIGKRIDNTRSTFVMIWTGIFAMVQLSFSAIKHFFSGNN